jgi:uncharacterized membrane protein
MDLIALVTGLILVFIGIGFISSSGGEDSIMVVMEKIGGETGINDLMLIYPADIILILAAVGYARNAYQESLMYKRGHKDTFRHSSPF